MLFNALIATAVLILCLAGVSCSDGAPGIPKFTKRGSGDSVQYGGGNKPLPEGEGMGYVAELPTLPDEDLPITAAGFRGQGEAIYASRCAACHLPVENSNRRGVDAGKIINDYTRNFPTHKAVEWPDAEEAFMIEAALAIQEP